MKVSPNNITDTLLNNVLKTITEFKMIRPGDNVLIAVSGGVDSMVLAEVLFRRHRSDRDRSGRPAFGVAHLNHELRGAAGDSDAAFVQRFAEKNNRPFFLETTPVKQIAEANGLNVEETARRERYRFLVKTARANGYTRIATGHHMNDQAEAVLMRLLRGSGPRGLSGISPMRADGVIRPLIHIRRSEIEAYAKENKIAHVTDETNKDTSYLRNRIRRVLLPALAKQYNPNIIENLVRTADVCRVEDDYIRRQSRRFLKQDIRERTEDTVTLVCDNIAARHPAVQRRIIMEAIGRVKGNTRRIGRVHIDAVRDLNRKKRPGFLHLPGRILVTKNEEGLTIEQKKVSLREIDYSGM